MRPRQVRYQAALRPHMISTIDSKVLSNFMTTPTMKLAIRKKEGKTGGKGGSGDHSGATWVANQLADRANPHGVTEPRRDRGRCESPV
jgi:hypothetical protein